MSDHLDFTKKPIAPLTAKQKLERFKKLAAETKQEMRDLIAEYEKEDEEHARYIAAFRTKRGAEMWINMDPELKAAVEGASIRKLARDAEFRKKEQQMARIEAETIARLTAEVQAENKKERAKELREMKKAGVVKEKVVKAVTPKAKFFGKMRLA